VRVLELPKRAGHDADGGDGSPACAQLLESFSRVDTFAARRLGLPLTDEADLEPDELGVLAMPQAVVDWRPTQPERWASPRWGEAHPVGFAKLMGELLRTLRRW
jgi:hypothetical protein